MLPEAEVAFLDEVFAGSTAILNTLLGILNERSYRRGSTLLACPLRVCIGASNALPDNESLAAFADRFLVRCFVQPVSDSMLEDLLSGGRSRIEFAGAEMPELDRLILQAQGVDLSFVQPLLARALRRLRKEGVELSDRRSVRSQNLIAAAASLGGRERATSADLWPLVLAVPTLEQQAMARDCLKDLLEESDNKALHQLAEEISAAPSVRARTLVEAGLKALTEPQDPLRVEGVLRDIDAGFSLAALPPELAEMRNRLKSALPVG
jgi:MoxR-like ATPase